MTPHSIFDSANISSPSHNLPSDPSQRGSLSGTGSDTLTAPRTASSIAASNEASIEALQQVIAHEEREQSALSQANVDELKRLQNQLESTLARVRFQPNIISKSPVMARLMQRLDAVAQSDLTVLLTGESGTGKSLLAQHIHGRSVRAERPFVVINCSALPSELIESELFGHTKGAFTGAAGERLGRIEAAEGGTIFLDEIGELPLALQPKLLTFLQDQTFQRIGSDRDHRANVRVIAATNRDLLEECRAGRFREDLYFRLSVLPLPIPALRERSEEIAALADQILARHSRGVRLRLDRLALERLERHTWPGNVRELENVLARATVFCRDGVIREEDLVFDPASTDRTPAKAGPGDLTDDMLAGVKLEELERRAITATLYLVGGNKAKAARVLGISERSVYNKIARWSLPF
ncbi:MAG: sigma 54-interacting transcriptional regulator [Pirellulaceae bacterium]